LALYRVVNAVRAYLGAVGERLQEIGRQPELMSRKPVGRCNAARLSEQADAKLMQRQAFTKPSPTLATSSLLYHLKTHDDRRTRKEAY
jgi:hypothetical protein